MRETLHEIICALVDGRAGSGAESGASQLDAAPSVGDISRLDAAWLDKLVRRHNRKEHDAQRRIAKKRLLPAYLRMRESEPETLREWGVDAEIDSLLVKLLRAKPRRTASGVATITVLTKPWPCSSDCLYCPNDVRMPKSYLAAEPACQRAERNFFDPYLQVTSRLRVLADMGHVTDKVELIVLGGTFSDYPVGYQIWFISELFRALNDAGCASSGLHAPTTRPGQTAEERISEYEAAGLLFEPADLAAATSGIQSKVNAGETSYNEAVGQLYGKSSAWEAASSFQNAGLEELMANQQANEQAKHRVVGLVVETRPDAISPASLLCLRQLGCTKVQMGIQSLSQHILDMNSRGTSIQQIARAFELLRLFGFKSHIHIMANLPGATPESDRREYLQLVEDPRFIPDEVKLYPCALVESSRLTRLFEDGSWKPYGEDELVDLLAADVMATPPYTRISRMIRDISATDIVAGNKKTNLRQMVEIHVGSIVADCEGTHSEGEGLECEKPAVQEMRMREIATEDVSPEQLRLERISYATTVSMEHFLQWVTPDNRLAGFLRLSISDRAAVRQLLEEFDGFPGCPSEDFLESADFRLSEDQAMIREVHVYGKVAALHEAGESAQHTGLGRKLIEAACDIARDAGRSELNVISSVGTREYYRKLGFADNGLYQTRAL